MKEYINRQFQRCCCPCLRRKRIGKILRTSVIISNILYWFSGCTVLSISIWLRFVDVGTKDYFSTFPPFDIALYVVIIASILYLVVSFVGTCAANTKNALMITLYATIGIVILIAEVVSLIVFSSYHSSLVHRFVDWYKNHFLQIELKYSSGVVHHVQSKMRCCGLIGPNDFYSIFVNETIPTSCMVQTKFEEDIIRPEFYVEGCTQKLSDLVTWLLESWPISTAAAVIIILQIVGIVSSSLFLQHLFYRRTFPYEDEDDESSGLIDSQSKMDYNTSKGKQQETRITESIHNLPHPTLHRIVKLENETSYGFKIEYSAERECFLLTKVLRGSSAEFAGLKVGGEVVELNGMLLQAAELRDVLERIEDSGNEIRIVVVDEKASSVYRASKVALNLRNLEGVTKSNEDYIPRFCRLKKGLQGFGFHLLYLEDRKGEYIEEVAEGSPAHQAGLCLGDRIIEVNGVNIENKKSNDVVKLVRMSGNEVTLLVVDPKTDGYFRKKGVTVTASLAVNFFSGKKAQSILVNRDSPKTCTDLKPRYCCLNKTAKEDFGLYVVIDNKRIGQVIRWVDCGGPADRAGLRIGDRIVEVNGYSVEYESHQWMMSCISVNSTLSHFVVVDKEYDLLYKRNKPRLCHIIKETESFGFSVCYSKSKIGHYVDEVDPNGPADRAGLKIGDRLIQVNGKNVERHSLQNVVHLLQLCDEKVILLVIDAMSNKHYEKIAEFKKSGLQDTQYDQLSMHEEPHFILNDEKSDTVLFSSKPEVSSIKDVSLLGQQSLQDNIHGSRQCVMNMLKSQSQPFSLSFDRNRNGYIITRIEKGGLADAAGLRNGDKILLINNEKLNNASYEEVLSKIKKSRPKVTFTVIDHRSDDFSTKQRPYLFRLVKTDSGYGFYLWFDENGHYVEEVTIGSPADNAGMRAGDRIIEINGVNVEEESHEEVFYRVKACMNVVTLLAVDQKTFKYYKNNNLPICVFKAESSFSGFSTQNTTEKESGHPSPAKIKVQDLKLIRKDGEDFGFNLAFTNSFVGEIDTGVHIVHWVETGGIADLSGLRDGDRIIAVNGIDVTKQDHDEVMEKIYQLGQYIIVLTIEYDDIQGSHVPHNVKISKIDGSFGFHLWFDENGHFIEDVTIGSPSDKAGMKIGDRVLEVNGKNIEDLVHADVVNLVRNVKEEITLLVYSVQNTDMHSFARPTTYTLTKKNHTFGFTIVKDDKGYHFDYVEPEAPADTAGIKIGDRLMEINSEDISDIPLKHVVSTIRSSGSTVTLTIMSIMGNITKYGAGESSSRFADKRILQEIKNIETWTGDQSENYTGTATSTEVPEMDLIRTSGSDNLAFLGDNSESQQMQKDPEGRYLEEKLSRAVSHATKLRRKPRKTSNKRTTRDNFKPGTQKRNRNLSYIERKFTDKTVPRAPKPKSTIEAHYYKDRKSRTERQFRMGTTTISLREQWDFEEGNKKTIKQEQSEDNNADNPVEPNSTIPEHSEDME